MQDWIEARLVRDWRLAQRWWSMRFAAAGAAATALFMFLPAVQALLPLWAFGALCLLFFALTMVARVTNQPSLDANAKQ
jgi:uncharacterized membrane protein HdeD (DUF308 family)